MRGIVALPAAALAALAVFAATATAQGPSPGAGRISGTVYDSLLGSPLLNAHVVVLHTSRGTVSDQRGRYSLDSVPEGRQVVAFSRPDLDSIGLSSFVAAVTVVGGGETTLPLATPSHATYWRAVCGEAAHGPGADSGIVFGTVTDAESRTRLAGSRVTVSWVTADLGRGHHIHVGHPSREVKSDSLGSYYMCGAPVEYLVTARATAGPFSSGLAEALVDLRGITRRDLSVSREVVGASADSAAAGAQQPHGLATVIGTARGDRGGVLPGSFASLDGVPGDVPADSAGQFVLRNLPSGTQMLMVRRVGTFAWRQVLDLRNRDTTRVVATLQEAIVLDTIRVTAGPRLAAQIEEIDLRRRTGFGYFLGPSEIRQRPDTRSLFEGMPSVETRGRSARDYNILMRGTAGWCLATVYMDGFPADVEQLSSMEPRSLLAVEVYPRPTASLGRYGSFTDCGVILVWTVASS